MTPAELVTLTEAITRLALLKRAELTPASLAAWVQELRPYDLPDVLAACQCATRTPGWLELASITAHLGDDIAAEAVLAWARRGGDAAIAEQARRAVGLDNRLLTDEQVRFLRRPFLETYTALAQRHRHRREIGNAVAQIGNPDPTRRLA